MTTAMTKMTIGYVIADFTFFFRLKSFSRKPARRLSTSSRIPPSSPARTMLVKSGENDFREFTERVGERGAAFDLATDRDDDRLELGVLSLNAEHVEAPHHRQSGVDHRGKLPREDDKRLFARPPRACQ